MPDIQYVMDVTINDLSPEQQVQLKDAIDQFQQKFLMSFGKNRSGVPYLKTEMPRVLLPGEPDTTAAQEKQEVLNAFRKTIDNVMVKHHTAFLNMFKQMMVGVFGPGMERMLSRVSPHTSSAEVGETSSAQPARDAGAQPPLQGQPIQPPPQSTESQPIQPPLQNKGGQPVQQPNPYQAMPNRPTYGDLAFGSSGMPPNSTYKIAPTNNRLQKICMVGDIQKLWIMALLMLSQILGMVQLQECKMMISWCRKWLMLCKINSALNLKCKNQLIHLLSQSGTIG
jgi:hypothetical protein